MASKEIVKTEPSVGHNLLDMDPLDVIKEEPCDEIEEYLSEEPNPLDDNPATLCGETDDLERSVRDMKTTIVLQTKKIKTLHQSINRQKKKKKYLEGKLRSIKVEKKVAIKKKKEKLILRQGGKKLMGKTSLQLKAFAITLHLLSPEAYNYVHSVFNTAIPNEEELQMWRSRFEESDDGNTLDFLESKPQPLP